MNDIFSLIAAHLLIFAPILGALVLSVTYLSFRFWHPLKQTPVLGFFLRYWLLLVTLVPFGYIYTTHDQNDWFFKVLGPGIYPPALCILAAVLALLARHFWFNKTVDADAASGQFVADWRKADPHVRIYATVALTIGILFSFAFIVGSTGK